MQNYLLLMFLVYVVFEVDVDVIQGIVVVQINIIQVVYVVELGVEFLEFVMFDEVVGVVCNGEVEVVFVDKDFLLLVVNEFNGVMVWVIGQDNILLGEGIGMVLCQFDIELKVKFDIVIILMKEDGLLNEMIKKWFGDGVEYF